MNPPGWSDSDMLHRLPPAPLVDRTEWLCARVEGRRVIHVGFVDAGCDAVHRAHDTWLHAHLAARASELIGLDVDEPGVARARADGYEAYAVDCRRLDDIRALGLAPADVVIAGEVIEHVDDPGTFLDGLHLLCAHDGVLVLTTPNPNGLLNTFASLGNYEINHPDHVIMFTWRTLTTLLRRHRWEPSETRTFVPVLKDGRAGTSSRLVRAGGRFVLWLERTLAKAGRPFTADGLIVVSRPAPDR